MKINLMYFLNKKGIDLREFCALNKVDTYQKLLEYCRQKGLICVEEKFYSEIFPAKIIESPKEVKSKHVKESTGKVSEPKKRGSSRARKTSRARASNKKD